MISMADPSVLMGPDFIHQISEQFKEMVEFREPSSFVYKAIRKDGTWFWAENNVNPIFDETTGELSEMIAVLRDITGRVDAEEALEESAKQKEMLMHEVHHRVKNNFAILSSLTSMHKDISSDENLRRLLDDLQFRIRTMALVHEQLYRTRSIDELIFGNYLKDLVKIISTAFKKENIEVSTESLNEYLNVDMILPLGLIVNELLTNAYKYAFPDGRKGKILVEYQSVPGKEENGKELRRLTVRDNGVGFSENYSEEKNGSLGTEIIRILSRQLDAEISIENNNGVSFSIIFPVGKD
jgi:two-component sensor histidine kinase